MNQGEQTFQIRIESMRTASVEHLSQAMRLVLFDF